MSEVVPEEEPEPLSWDLQKFINESIVDAGCFTDDESLAYYQANDEFPDFERTKQLERERQERAAVRLLSAGANARFEALNTSPFNIDVTIPYGDKVALRRRIKVDKNDPTKIIHKSFFFYDDRGKRPYCRAWAEASSMVNWCDEQGLHELALGVLDHLNEAFPLPRPPVAEPLLRRIAAPVLRRLSRKTV